LPQLRKKICNFLPNSLSVNLKRESHEFVAENGGITYIDKKENKTFPSYTYKEILRDRVQSLTKTNGLLIYGEMADEI
jgi:hypothetical protein